MIAFIQIPITHKLYIHFYAIKIAMKHVTKIKKIAKNVVVKMAISGVNIW